MDLNLLEFLDAGGNIAMMALLFVMWKFDRRLVKIEILIEHHLENDK